MKKILEFMSASITFSHRQILKPFSLEVFAGDIIGISGVSGSGKSSVLRLAAGLIKPASGSVKRIDNLRMGFAFQTPRLLPWKTAWENVAVPLMNMGISGGESEQKSRELLAEFGLSDAADYYPASLSGGMAQRVSLARALAVEPELLLLDEPMTGLDAVSKENAWNVIKKNIKNGETAVMIAAHHPEDIRIYFNCLLCCNEGELISKEKK